MTSEFCDNDLIMLSRLNRHQVAEWLRIKIRPYGARGADRTLDIIRNLQIALVHYSKKRQFDRVQSRMLGILSKFEKWARLEYYRVKTSEVLKDHPDWATEPEKVKMCIKANWENYFKARCY